MYPSSIDKINIFSGTLNVFDLNGNKLDQIVIKKGNASSVNKNTNSSTFVNAINLFYESQSINSRAATCDNTYEVSIHSDIYVDSYNIAYVKNGASITFLGTFYMGTKYVGTNYSTATIAGPCNSTADYIQILQRQSSYRDYYINDHITFDGLNPCSQAVMQQLINAPSKSVITEIYNKLGANFTKYDVQIKSEMPSNMKPANTFQTSPFNYTIQLNSDFSGATKLGRAATLLHELVHAYFISLFDDYHNANPKDLNAYTNFPFLYDLYVTKKYPSSTNPADIQHQQMADSYVDAIARNLQEYQTGIVVPDNQTPEQIYSDLAWGGLRDAPVFDVKYPEGTLARDRVINRYNCEMVGHGVDEGTPKEQKPIGKPCN